MSENENLPAISFTALDGSDVKDGCSVEVW